MINAMRQAEEARESKERWWLSPSGSEEWRRPWGWASTDVTGDSQGTLGVKGPQPEQCMRRRGAEFQTRSGDAA